MGLRITQVDAFTDKRFRGNPAAVCILPEAPDAAWMRDVAREMNLAETAFLVRQSDGFSLRWFTPAVEVDLCGHATLASAHVLCKLNFVAYQASARGGIVRVGVEGDRVRLGGQAVTVLRGELA